MRQALEKQQPLIPSWGSHQHSRELRQISTILDEHPELSQRVRRDLVGKRSTKNGRRGLSGDQAMRIGLLKQIGQLDYRALAFHLQDSASFRAFCRIPMDADLKPSTLQLNVKRIREGTWEEINRALVKYAQAEGIELGRRIRTDCTAVECNIHEPTDSSLLWDCVRVITRLLKQAAELFPGERWSFHDRTRRAKRRAYEIQFPKRGEQRNRQRERLYGDLLAVTQEVHDFGVAGTQVLAEVKPASVVDAMRAEVFASQLASVLDLTKKVMTQTRRRVLEGQQVPSSEKLVSIFETHADVIVKGRLNVVYGHKICLTGGASSLILDCVIEDGNPADKTMVKRSIERIKGLFGKAPEQASFDGGFASQENLHIAKEAGVKEVAFQKRCGLEVGEMASSPRAFRRLTRFRAGIEACISGLKRAFGLDRAMWRGLEGFKRYVWSGIVSFNALMIARQLLARDNA